ncbi:hypothetical protein PIB30_045275 [Stylosanthes scabra]|uniref:Uncharacterized protein n=1 Tax=Stylosanthes scabra TaxID=79078 RepID=A0ABU6RG33_9FABA|nr:hypothetical protein [Stylosanthes scabra]
MQDRFMEFCAKVHHVGGSSSFRPFVPQAVPSPINVAPPDDVASADDSDYEDESSCHRTEEDEDVLNTPSVRGPRLELDLDTRYAEDPSMKYVADEYNIDEGVEFRVGYKMQNRPAVFMSMKNYSIRRNAEYKLLSLID